MIQVARALHHWLMQNNLPTQGVRMIVEFPEQRHMQQAEMYIKRDLEQLLIGVPGADNSFRIETAYDISVSLRARKSKGPAGDRGQVGWLGGEYDR